MPTLKLTSRTVLNAAAPAAGRRELWDTLVPGLGLRITEKSVKTWVLMCRDRGRQRRLTLGRYPDLGLADARERARDWRRQIARGADPVVEARARAAPPQPPETVEAAVREFIAKHARPKNRRWKETERVFAVHVLPLWGDRPVRAIARRDIVALLDGMLDRGVPYMANRVLAALRRMLNWCVERGTIDANPAAGLRAPGREVARDRVLSDAEIRALWASWTAMGWPFGPAFQLLLVTAQRRSEVAIMRWADIDAAAALWTVPREATKADRRHEVPLPPLALDILRTVPRLGPHVFTTNGETPISGFSTAKARSDALSGVTGWRPHDLRRTAASGMARLGVAPHVIEKALNHASGQLAGVAGVYNRYGYAAEKRDALERWAAALAAMCAKPDRVEPRAAPVPPDPAASETGRRAL